MNRPLQIFLLGWAFWVQPATGATAVKLAWEPSPEPDVSGYAIYYGTNSRAYDWLTNVGNVTLAAVDGLREGVPYYFAVVARNTAGLESDFSNEITVIPAPATNQPPTVSRIERQTIKEGESGQVDFVIGDAETSAVNLLVSVIGANQTLLGSTNLLLSGAGAFRTLRIRPKVDQFGLSQITVSVSDGQTTTDATFQLEVREATEPVAVLTIWTRMSTSLSKDGPWIPFFTNRTVITR